MELIDNSIILGTSHLGSVWRTPKSEFYFLDSVVDAGFRTFDLAASYQIGGTERLFGHWMAARQNRNRLFLISKGGHPHPIIAPNRLTLGALQADLEASLRRLRTDYLDLYLLHRDHPDADLQALADFLVRSKQSGKIKNYGVSNWHHERIQQLGLDIAASSPHFSLAAWEKQPWKGCVSIAGGHNQAARDFYTRTQIPVLAWAPLRGTKSPEAALTYLANQPFPVFPIVGSRNLKHLEENEKIMGRNHCRLRS